MTVTDVTWFLSDLVYDLTHIADVELFSLALRLGIVFVVGLIAYRLILRPLLVRPLVAFMSARQAARDRATRAEQEQHGQALRIEGERGRLREVEMEHEREIARLRIEEQRLAAEQVAAEQQREAAERVVQKLEDDLK